MLPDSILSRNSLYISKNNKIKTYYFNEGPQTNLKINNELLIREFNKGIDSFIKCIEEEEVSVALILQIAKSGKAFLKNKNKNMLFSIRKNSLESLFNLIYYLEN